MIESGQADLVAFGRPFISKPDLVERFASGLGLEAEMSVWYTDHGVKGYTDPPRAKV